MTIYLNMQKNIAQIRVHKRRPIAVTKFFLPNLVRSSLSKKYDTEI